MNIAVIGGAGFVGSALVRRLASEHPVTVIDNFSRGSIVNLPEHVTLITTDAREVGSLAGFDLVYDFAARVYGVRDLYKDPAALLSDNIAITTAVLRAVAQAEVPYLYVSSSCVYDFPGATVPHVETDTNICDTSYGFSKVVGEQLVKWYAKQYGFPYRVARLFNVYGPGDSMQSPHVIPEFLVKARAVAQGETTLFPILGSGEQTRDFTFMDDVVDGLVTIATNGVDGEAYNVGTGREVSIMRLAELVCAEFGIAPTFIHQPVAAEDIQRRSADSSKLRSLGWTPSVTLEAGIHSLAIVPVAA